jgi:hypothetical protein
MSRDAMNESKVEKLFYQVIIPEHTDYDSAPPVSGETDDFKWHLSKDQLLIEMKSHYSSEDEAREIVDQFLESWEVTTALLSGPESLTFSFDRSQILAREQDLVHSEITELDVSASEVIQLSDVLRLHVSHAAFPVPPQRFRLSPEAEMMFQRYKLYRAGRESLLGMARWCLTVVEYSARGREGAVDQYRIDLKVIRKLGELCGNREDITEARKSNGPSGVTPLKPAEREWIKSVIKRLILRVGEYGFDPNARMPQITMSDFQGAQ